MFPWCGVPKGCTCDSKTAAEGQDSVHIWLTSKINQAVNGKNRLAHNIPIKMDTLRQIEIAVRRGKFSNSIT